MAERPERCCERQTGFVLRQDKGPSRREQDRRGSELEEVVEGLLGAGRLRRFLALTAMRFRAPKVVRGEKSVHSLATSLGDTRAGDPACTRSGRPDRSGRTAQDRRSCWHFGHLLREKICASTNVPQRAQRATWREPGMSGFLAPSDEMRRAPAGRRLTLGALIVRLAVPLAPVTRRSCGRTIAVVVLVAALPVFAVAHSSALVLRIHRLAADDRPDDLDVLDRVGIDVVRILLEHHEVGELAGGDRALDVLFVRGVGAVDGGDRQRLVDGDLLVRVPRRAARCSPCA